jgi:general secretion pathway protein G
MKIYKKQKNGGFTLIELLVVISIISFLSSVVFASLSVSRVKAKVAKAKQEIRSIYNGILRYNIEKNTWPGMVSGNLSTSTEWNSAWKTGIIDAPIPADPWGNQYFYDGNPGAANGECATGNTAVCSSGPDGVDNGSFNRADMTSQGDDICIYFEATC